VIGGDGAGGEDRGRRELSLTDAPRTSRSIEDVLSALRDRVDGEVRFDDGSRAACSTDASNFRQVPIGVVVPRTIEAAVETVAVCHEQGLPIVNRGGGTSLAGQCTNEAVVSALSSPSGPLRDTPLSRAARTSSRAACSSSADGPVPGGSFGSFDEGGLTPTRVSVMSTLPARSAGDRAIYTVGATVPDLGP
jgi:hypothetical protein